MLDGEITMESAESTPSQDQKDNTNVENTQNNEVQSSTVQVESQSVALLPTDELKQEEKTEDFSIPDPYLPKMKNHHKQHGNICKYITIHEKYSFAS